MPSFFIKFSVFICLSLFSQISQAKWQLYYQAKDLKISYQPLKKSGLYQVKASVRINSNIEEFYHLLTDQSIAATWLDRVKKVTLLKSVDTTTFIVLTHFEGFGPVYPREMVTESQLIEKTLTKLHIKIKDKNDYMPVTKGFIRVKNVDVTWLASFSETNGLTISYISSFDPAGSLPIWLSNKYALSSIKTSLQNLQKLKPFK
ncbi:MAG: START domain-containing protein [Thalassotalea sp.]|nr:START domain-containing protein [Thalassotalea sp.]MDG2393842.1 START domain-containing protein [Thalassotalea sp.]